MNRYSRQNIHGIGMVEILVTMFILGVGLLGVASLQFVGSFTNAEALSRTQAEFVAQQAVERLRAASVMDMVADGLTLDAGYFTDSNYNFASLSCGSGGSDKFACFCTARPGGVPDCENGQCNEPQMAAYDAWVLSCSAVQSNPQTLINISCADNPNVVDGLACSPGSFIQVQLRWPLRTQQNTEIQQDSRCAQDTNQAYACVTKVITL